jgi:uncharacterized protein (DUF983 family)
MKNVSKLQAIIGAKCPHCRQGDIFEYPASRLSRFTETRERCPVCNQRYEVEPGFFIGAMYISYSFAVALMVAVSVAVFVLGNDPDLWVYLVAVIVANLLLVPFMFRYSRVLMLYWFSGIKYNPRAAP